jgi:hypothetical protein
MTTSNVFMSNEAISYLENIAQHTVERSVIKKSLVGEKAASNDLQHAGKHGLSTGEHGAAHAAALGVTSRLEEIV